MAANTDFFERISPQAVLKHGLLTRYAFYFAVKAGRATGGRVAFIDGYAGEGRYADGNHGSPLLLASSSERAATFGRDVKLAFVEQDDEHRRHLRSTLKEQGVDPDQLVNGEFQNAVDGLLERYADRATLMFVDPFGLALDRSTLEAVLKRSSPRQPIDVLFHFSLLSVARMAPAELAETLARDQQGPNAVKLNAALGDVDWRARFEAAVTSRATNTAIAVAEEFAAAVGKATGARHTSIQVRQRPGHLPKYLLMLFSKHDQAHWDFADQAGVAYVDWLHHCSKEDFLASVQASRAADTPSLFDEPEPEPDRSSAEARVAELVGHALPTHLARLLSERRSLRLVDHVADAYGDLLGRARATHVRAAIKTLHGNGVIDDDGKGEFWKRTITWRGQN